MGWILFYVSRFQKRLGYGNVLSDALADLKSNDYEKFKYFNMEEEW